MRYIHHINKILYSKKNSKYPFKYEILIATDLIETA